MPLIIALIGILGVAAVWIWRARQAGDAASDILDAANDVRLAARRFGFRRRTNIHPIDSIDDARLAATGILIAIAEMDGAVSEKELQVAAVQIQSKFGIEVAEAKEMVTFGRWIAGQSGTRDEAIRKLSKRLLALAGAEAGPDLAEMMEAVAKADGNPPDERMRDAIDMVRRRFQ